jgi:hypothetical protein
VAPPRRALQESHHLPMVPHRRHSPPHTRNWREPCEKNATSDRPGSKVKIGEMLTLEDAQRGGAQGAGRGGGERGDASDGHADGAGAGAADGGGRACVGGHLPKRAAVQAGDRHALCAPTSTVSFRPSRLGPISRRADDFCGRAQSRSSLPPGSAWVSGRANTPC